MGAQKEARVGEDHVEPLLLPRCNLRQFAFTALPPADANDASRPRRGAFNAAAVDIGAISMCPPMNAVCVSRSPEDDRLQLARIDADLGEHPRHREVIRAADRDADADRELLRVLRQALLYVAAGFQRRIRFHDDRHGFAVEHRKRRVMV